MFTYKPERAKVPLKIWMNKEDYASDEKMVNQLENVSSLPFLHCHIALSPDGHAGYGCPIGSVVATKDVIIPNLVGVDIGCGMSFVETNIPKEVLLTKETSGLTLSEAIVQKTNRIIPLGFSKHKKPRQSPIFDFAPDLPIIQENLENAKCSLGTLGGGNHFIEIQENEFGNICFMLHSGSRNLGYRIANHYNKIAKELNKNYLYYPFL
jgi:tRNA-splicing ligase RtcB